MSHSIYGDRRPTRDECIRNAGAWLAGALAEQDALSPRQAAERAHCKGGPSVDELERLIRAERGLEPRQSPVGGPTTVEPLLQPASTGATREDAPEQDPVEAAAGPPAPAFPQVERRRAPRARPPTAATSHDPLAAVAGLSTAQRLALADAIRAEHGEGQRR